MYTPYDHFVTVDPSVSSTSGPLRRVWGQFYRAVGEDHIGDALSGSIAAGRYSRPGQPTLYLSASPEGVEAAMVAHGGRSRRIRKFAVQADSIFDLRDAAALDLVTRADGSPFGDWQQLVSAGQEPASWRTRDRVELLGAKGLIDPSRKAPGLWHLVLFEWNVPGAPTVAA